MQFKSADLSNSVLGGFSFSFLGVSLVLLTLSTQVKAADGEVIHKEQVPCTATSVSVTVPITTTHVWWMNNRCFCGGIEAVVKREALRAIASKGPIKPFTIPSTPFKKDATTTSIK